MRRCADWVSSMLGPADASLTQCPRLRSARSGFGGGLPERAGEAAFWHVAARSAPQRYRAWSPGAGFDAPRVSLLWGAGRARGTAVERGEERTVTGDRPRITIGLPT